MAALPAQDRRRFDVSLTAKGRRRISNIWPEHADGIRRYFVDPLQTEDRKELSRVLAVLISVNEAGLGQGPATPDDT